MTHRCVLLYFGIIFFTAPKSKTTAETTKMKTPIDVKPANTMIAESKTGIGRASGKRTLSGVMDEDIAMKRARQGRAESTSPRTGHAISRFFGAGPTSRSPVVISDDELITATEQSCHEDQIEDEENISCIDNDDDADDDILMEEPDPVIQEDGYMTPSPSLSRRETPDLSSPHQLNSSVAKVSEMEATDDFGAEILSSPLSSKSDPSRTMARLKSAQVSRRRTLDTDGNGRILVRGSPSLSENDQEGLEQRHSGPDLRNILWNEDIDTSDIEYIGASQRTVRTASSSPGPETPDDFGEQDVVDDVYAFTKEVIDVDELDEVEEVHERTLAAQKTKVANGWWEKWARSGTNRNDNHRVSFHYRPFSSRR